MPLIPFIITLTLPIVSIILTEFILSSKNNIRISTYRITD